MRNPNAIDSRQRAPRFGLNGFRMLLVPLSEYSYARIHLQEGSVDGPFLMQDGNFGLLLSLRGKEGGTMPTAGEIRWQRDVPPRMRTEPVRMFLRVKGGVLYLGDAMLSKRGKPERDGFRAAFELKEPLTETMWTPLMAEVTAPPPPPAEEMIAALGKESTTEQRIAAMRSFLERWFDCKPAGNGNALDILLATIGDKTICVHNTLQAPDAERIFYVENQGVCQWAFGEGEDPPVVVKYERGWKEESPSLSAFLIQMLVLEATFGARFGTNQDSIDGRTLKKLVKRVLPLPIGHWHTSRVRFFGSNGVIGFAIPNGSDFDLWLGAQDRQYLEPLDDLVNV